MALGAVAMATMLVLAGCAGVLSGNPDADEIAQQLQDRQDEIDDIQGVMTIESDFDGEATETTMEFWERPNTGEHRSEVIESTGFESEGDVTVHDGTTTWIYDSEANEVTRLDLDLDLDEMEIDEGEIIESMLDEYDVEYNGTETIGDHDTHVLELTPTDEADEEFAYDELTMWVDDEYWYPVKQDATMSVGEETVTTTITYEELAFNEGIDDEKFTFDVPDGAEVVEAELPETEQFDSVSEADDATEFDVAEPDVPDEYEFDSATVSEHESETSVSLLYENDEYLFVSISETKPMTTDGETVEVGDTEATIHDMPGTTSLQFECDGLYHDVSGDLDEDKLIEIAEPLSCE